MSLKAADFFVQQTARAKAPQINTNKIFIQERKDGIIFRIRIKPSAPRNEIKGLRGGALKIDINALPMKGRANRECIRFLAKELKVPKSNIEILSGLKSKDKLVKIKGIDKGKALKALCLK